MKHLFNPDDLTWKLTEQFRSIHMNILEKTAINLASEEKEQSLNPKIANVNKQLYKYLCGWPKFLHSQKWSNHLIWTRIEQARANLLFCDCYF